MNPRYAEVALRASHRCEYCHAPEVVFNLPFEVEHVVPRCREGSESDTNLALACRSCNLRKGDHIDGLDPETLAVVPLFHPRTDRWEEHFRVNLQTGEIEGITEIGRTTVARLAMNSLPQVEARRQWMRLGVFP